MSMQQRHSYREKAGRKNSVAPLRSNRWCAGVATAQQANRHPADERAEEAAGDYVRNEVAIRDDKPHRHERENQRPDNTETRNENPEHREDGSSDRHRPGREGFEAGVAPKQTKSVNAEMACGFTCARP